MKPAIVGQWRHCARAAAVMLIVLSCLAGCVSDPTREQRLARYHPDVSANERMPWLQSGARGAGSTDLGAATDPIRRPVKGVREGPRDMRSPVTPVGGTVRVLAYGDRLNISLIGIPVPSEFSEAIDTEGNVTLPHIGDVEIVSMSTSDASKKIEQIYKDEGIYPRINVILIPLVEGFYFLRGEIKGPSRYPMLHEVTLLGAIYQAGGFTPWANPKKIQIIREGESYYYNSVDIEKNKEDDPVIQSGDKIVVHKRWI